MNTGNIRFLVTSDTLGKYPFFESNVLGINCANNLVKLLSSRFYSQQFSRILLSLAKYGRMCFLIFKRDFFFLFLGEIQIHSRNMRTKLGIQNSVPLFLPLPLCEITLFSWMYNRVNYIYFFLFFPIFACTFVLFLFSSQMEYTVERVSYVQLKILNTSFEYSPIGKITKVLMYNLKQFSLISWNVWS